MFQAVNFKALNMKAGKYKHIIIQIIHYFKSVKIHLCGYYNS